MDIDMRKRRSNSYLLRLWREKEEDQLRMTLEDAHSGKRIGFSELHQLVAFLSEVTQREEAKSRTGTNT